MLIEVKAEQRRCRVKLGRGGRKIENGLNAASFFAFRMVSSLAAAFRISRWYLMCRCWCTVNQYAVR